jgi:hypothetical protein
MEIWEIGIFALRLLLGTYITPKLVSLNPAREHAGVATSAGLWAEVVALSPECLVDAMPELFGEQACGYDVIN